MKFKFRGYLGKVFLWLLTMLTVVGTLQAQQNNQGRINADLAVPNLEVENGAKTFRVRINKTDTECADGYLNIKLPSGFKYVEGTAKVGAELATSEEVSEGGDAVTIPLGTIPAAADAPGYVEVSFDVEALCGALGLNVDDRFVSYTLTGCGTSDNVKPAKGNTINLKYAVLNISVTPSLTLGAIGQEITRTIVIKNSGTGGLKSFQIPVEYGPGIKRLADAEPSELPKGLTYDENKKTYIYTGNMVSGGSLEFTEKVKVESCDGLLSTYEVVYADGCSRHNNDKVSVAVQIDDTKRPRLTITDKSAEQLVCLGGTYDHVWEIKNTGDAPASLIELGINATTIDGGVTVTDAENNQQHFTGSNIEIERLLPGEVLTVKFKQQYKGVQPAANCTIAPKEYNTESAGYAISYQHIEGCIGGKTPQYNATATTKAGLTFSFEGNNLGEEDIIGDIPYEADFKIGTWSFPKEGLQDNAYLEIVIDLSDDLSISDLSNLKLFSGASNVAVDIHEISDKKYIVRVGRESLVQNTEGNWRLKFPLSLDCPSTVAETFYKITATLHNCGIQLPFTCETVSLNSMCPEGDCPNGGMQKGTVSLERVTLGYEDLNNDGIPDNANTASGLGESIRSFVAGDIIEISQQGIVKSPENDADYVWNSGGRFEVTVVDANLGMVSTDLFGKVVLTRGQTTSIFENITITSEGNKFFITLPVENAIPGFTGFEAGDAVVASLQLKATKANEETELKSFTTVYGLYDESELAVLRSCGILHRVSGYYAATELSVGAVNATYNIPNCVSGHEGAGLTINFAIDGDAYRNALFPDEFREIAKPKSIDFEVPAGLTMKGYRVELHGNGANPTHVDVDGLTVSGTTYTVDAGALASHLRKLKGDKAEGAIDEGFSFIVRPIVTPNCDAGLEETITVTARVDGSFYYGSLSHIDAENVELTTQTLKYKTDKDKLEVKVSQVSTKAYTQEAKWVVSVSNRSEFRQFSNLWIGKNGGSVDISNVKEIKSLTDMTVVNADISKNGEVYNLANINAEQTRYFLITANVVNCKDGNLVLSYGNSCEAVPASVADATCKIDYPETLSFTLVDPILQTTVIQDPGVGPVPICAPIEYIVEVNNAGGEAKDLKLNIKLASFLNYHGLGGDLEGDLADTRAYISGVHATRPDNIVFDKIVNDVQLNTEGTEATIVIKAEDLGKLQNGERFYLKFKLKVANCNFRSGQTITLTPAAKNSCGAEVKGEEKILEAGTDRIVLDGAPLDEPVVDLTGEVKINLTPATAGAPLTATYTAVVTNIGEDDKGHPITGRVSHDADGSKFIYNYALKLPDGWVIDNPQAFIAANKLKYTNVLDPVKGYIFEFNEDLAFQERITLTGEIRFEGDVGSIDCGNSEYTFGNIQQEVYTTFKPAGKCGLAKSCGGMELLTKDHSTPFDLSQISPTGASEIAFCEDLDVEGITTPTLADLTAKIGRKGILEWYRDKELTDQIEDETELLVTETDYYAVNRLVEGASCVSAPLKVRVYLEVVPTEVSAGVDQLKYNDGNFTLVGSAPPRSNSGKTGSTGKWTVITPPAEGTVDFEDDTKYNTKVSIKQGTEVTLRWTVTNSCGVEVHDDVVLTSKTAKLKITKTASPVIDNNGDGRDSAGDLIKYSFTIENTGQAVIKAPISIVDDKLEGWGGAGKVVSVVDLAPGAKLEGTAVEVGEYTISLADMDAGEVVNRARATGQTPEGIGHNGNIDPKVVKSGWGTTKTPLTQAAELELIKSSSKVVDTNNDKRHSAGDQITYTFVVTNTGNVTITDLKVIDNKLGLPNGSLSFNKASLEPGDHATATRAYTLKQEDIDAGFIENTATVEGTDPKDKTVDDVSDTGTDRNGTPIDDPSKDGDDNPTILDLKRTPGIKLEKTGVYKGDKDRAEVGDAIEYTFVVTNTGNVTLTDVELTDTDFTGKGEKLDITGPTGNPSGNTASSLMPNATLTYKATYKLTQEDINAGGVYNQAVAKAKDPKGGDVEDKSTDPTPLDPSDPNYDPKCADCTFVGTPHAPSLSLTKEGEYKGAAGSAQVGDAIEYTFVVTNTGNVTLTDVELTDTDFTGKGDKLDITGPTGNPSGNTASSLMPNATLTYKAIYLLTQEDIDAGGVYNQAVVTAKDPKGGDVEDKSTDPTPLDPSDPNYDPKCADCTFVGTPHAPSLEVIKTASRAIYSNIGDDITYTIKVTNTGNVTLTDFVFSDTMFPNWAPNPKLDKLEPGDSREYTIVKTITQEILTAGKDLFNKMSVTANDPNGKPVEDDDNVTVAYKKNIILASPDKYGSFNGRDGGTTTTVLENDKLNDVVVQSGQVILTPGTVVDEKGKPIQGIVMNTDGTISITKGVVPAGTYTYPYTICEALNTTNCSSTEATIVIIASPIKAENDKYENINGKVKTVTPSVLENDKLNNEKVDPKDVKITVEKPADPRNPGEPVPTLNPSTGKVTINPETPAGEYKITYEICEVLNPTNCSTAIVTITVVAPEIKAIDDVYGTYNGKDGGDTGSVLENDLLNKVKVNPEDIELRAGVPVNERGEVVAGLSMNKTGNIHVQKETAAGKYYYPYEIEEKLNPGNKDDAVAIVTVIAAPIEAKNDKYDVNGKNGGTTPTVLDNDKLNNKTIIPNEITLTPGNPVDSKGNPTTVVKMNLDGTITVAPNTPQGRFEYPYTICEVLNPTNCANAVAIIEVQPAPIVAENDTYKVEWTRDKVTTGSVLSNDKYNEKPIDLDEVTLQPGVPSNPGLTMNPDGTIDIAPSTRPGTYTYPYTICEVLNPTNCSNAIATIVIEASNVFIPNTFTPNGDGVNDKFEIVGLDGYDQVKLTIVNRWGNEVYRNDNYNNEWNGSGLNEGTYYYIVTLRKGTTDTVHKGWVLIKTR